MNRRYCTMVVIGMILSLVLTISQAATKTYSHHYTSSSTATAYSGYVRVPLRLPSFSSLQVNGPFHVVITGGQRHSKVVLSGNSASVAQVSAQVVNHTLVLGMIPTKDKKNIPPGPVRVDIALSGPIYTLTSSGAATIRAEHVFASSWVNVAAYDQSTIYISAIGAPRVFTARLSGAVCLDARYLRAQQVYVQTQGQAIALVSTSYALYAFASDASNIYYFSKPHVLSGYAKQAADVLKVPGGNDLPPYRLLE